GVGHRDPGELFGPVLHRLADGLVEQPGLRTEVVADGGQVGARFGHEVTSRDVCVSLGSQQPPRGREESFSVAHPCKGTASWVDIESRQAYKSTAWRPTSHRPS